MECAPELASPNFPGEALCFEEPAFHKPFYVHPAVTVLLQAVPLLKAFSWLMTLTFLRIWGATENREHCVDRLKISCHNVTFFLWLHKI